MEISVMAGLFAPQEELADALLPHALENEGDGSHDIAHLLRVWNNARAIHAEEGGDIEILLAATILHDCVAVEKGSPLRAQASGLAAVKASAVLKERGWSEAKVLAVAHAIEAHSFSADITPATTEAKILQDADRLDAIGMIGAARCFYVAGRLGRSLHHPVDPQAHARPRDDAQFAVDHFHSKLLTLSARFQTKAGARMAAVRHARLERFLTELMDEIGAPSGLLAGDAPGFGR
jgi:uncharacterized protein